ncbi:unnamed protein product [Spirodela intermedia]|uniref:DUF668 domain-containing protein n=1 Tax=Spirodela intermedia TaxID=51605 RepID=A0A7I8IS04_SPIIN|nr:unnamed protein product [Spirodela intermedia]CAA6660742.1 unnamed protein product [Spirodela intermedia]
MVVESWFDRLGLLHGERRNGACGAENEVAATLAPTASRTLVSWPWSCLGSSLGSPISGTPSPTTRSPVSATTSLVLEGVQKLVSDDRGFLFALALSEMLEALGATSRAAALLARRCSIPVLRRLEQVLPDIVTPTKKMERKVRKMERLAAATVHLYQEMEVLAEMEQSLRRAQANTSSSLSGFSQGVSLIDLGQKVAWQRQEVKALRDQSLWNRSYDYIVRLVARALFTVVVRINLVFGFHRIAHDLGKEAGDPNCLPRSYSEAGRPRSSSLQADRRSTADADLSFCSGPLEGSWRKSGSIAAAESGPIGGAKGAAGEKRPGAKHLPPLPGGKSSTRTRWSLSGGAFGGCMLSGKDSPVLPGSLKPLAGLLNPRSEKAAGGGGGGGGSQFRRSNLLGCACVSLSLFDSKWKLVCTPSTLGASALALRFANIIIVIEKLAEYPHLIGPEARDDLYSMLPTSVKAALRVKLKPYTKNLAVCVYDPALAAEWSDALTRILDWLSPLAHNMVRWQSERNYEQQHWFSRSNVLLLQTLYFADQAKTEAAVVELLVGLNYLWRSAKEMDGRAVLECVHGKESVHCYDAK